MITLVQLDGKLHIFHGTTLIHYVRSSHLNLMSRILLKIFHLDRIILIPIKAQNKPLPPNA